TTLVEVCPWLPNVPTTERLHVSEVSAFVLTEQEAPAPPDRAPTAEAEAVAGLIREIVQDGDTVQIGAGRTATFLGVLGAFDGKRDLGWHSEITPRGIVPLMMDGTFNSTRKNIDRGVHITTTISARDDSEREWLEHDPPVETRAVREVNAIQTISAIERMTAINNAFQVDLTGQICSESLGTTIYNGTGGQPEFHIGAFIAPGGKAITVLPSATTGGVISRIVPKISDGSYVTVPRMFADYVVTEYGIAQLAGRSQRQRAKELIAVAHPDHRAELRAASKTVFYPSGVSSAVE
ncbi:MAG: acetyl-CoA hydrolase/transferase C-terminal domain-containing protein, partial [Dehalococcoidia bacterium]